MAKCENTRETEKLMPLLVICSLAKCFFTSLKVIAFVILLDDQVCVHASTTEFPNMHLFEAKTHVPAVKCNEKTLHGHLTWGSHLCKLGMDLETPSLQSDQLATNKHFKKKELR